MVCLGYMENNKYEKGKIYLITDVAYTKCYYGSTCEELSKRFWRHKDFGDINSIKYIILNI